MKNPFSAPSNDRDWNVDQAILPYSEIHGDLVSIYNIRNFLYTTTTDFTPEYYDKTFDLTKIKKVYYIVEPFSGYIGAAHAFLSFEFVGDEFVAISIEIRKKKGDYFSAVKGLLNQYELMYVIADERDVVKLRSNFRKDNVFIYPMKATREQVALLFVSMLQRANSLKEKPEYYNTVTNGCVTNIADHVNALSPGKIAFCLPLLLPANSDKLALDLGLIDTDLPIEKARTKYLINARASQFADSPDFSRKIRE